MTVTRIDFVDNATTKEAGIYAIRYGWAFVKGVCREVNEFVHRLPWVCIGAVLIVATSVSYVCIAEARAERDKANKAQPRAVHKLVKVHLLRTQSSQPFILRNIQL